MSDPEIKGPLAHMARSVFTEFQQPDPWTEDEDRAARDAEAVPLCINCLFPQGPYKSFCPRCGFPIGDCVALNPYLQVFVLGELARQGVAGPPERRWGVQLFLILVSVAKFSIFAPVYWYWMFQRSIGNPIRAEARPPLELDEEP